MNFAYIRVSTTDQNTARQEESLAQYHIDRSFVDKLSGKDVNRPQLELLMQFARQGDCIYIHSLDRLGRSLTDLLNLVKVLTENGVSIRFVKENLYFEAGKRDPMSIFLLQVMGAFAQFEREIIRERQREGIAIAKANGVYTGRKRKLSGIQEIELIKRADSGESLSLLAVEFGISRPSIYVIRERIKAGQG